MAVVQQIGGSAEIGQRAATAALSRSATPRNALISAIAIDKDSGSVPAPSTGWTLINGRNSASVSFAMAWRVADGTSTDQCRWSWTTGSNDTWWIAELDRVGPNPRVHHVANFTNEAAVTSVALGPLTPLPNLEGMIVGAVGIDTASNWVSGGRATTWSNGFVEQDGYMTVGGDVGVALTWADSSGSTASTTATAVRASADQASGMLVAIGTFAYRETILTDRPSAYFRLGETRGTSAADELGGTAGTYRGTFTLNQVSLTPESTDRSVLLNGRDAYIEVADRAAFDLTDTFTLECWVRLNRFSDSATNPVVFMDKGTNHYILRIANSLDGLVLFRRNGVANICTSTVRLVLGNIYHIVVTKSGATVRMYIQAVDVTGTVTNSTMTNNNNALGIGVADITAGPLNGFLDGWIDEVAFYPTALSADRVAEHFRAGVTQWLSRGASFALGNRPGGSTGLSTGGSRAVGNSVGQKATLASGGSIANGQVPSAVVGLSMGGVNAQGLAPRPIVILPSGGASAEGLIPVAVATIPVGAARARGIRLIVESPRITLPSEVALVDYRTFAALQAGRTVVVVEASGSDATISDYQTFLVIDYG